ncbi:MAG: glycoside hydrolase family 5 protein [Thermoproteota archaeon]
MDVFEWNKRIGRGVNILGYDPVWRSRPMARMRNEHFKLLASVGFNSVRIALHPLRDGAMSSGNRLSEYWLETLDWAVEQALGNRLVPIIDFHEFIMMGKDPLSNRGAFLSFWEQVGERYKDYPDEVVFEPLNEPNGALTPELWNRLLLDVLNVIRRRNPNRIVIIGPACWNSINCLNELMLPEDDENIIVTVHYYEPMDFTHQGAKWAGREDKVGIKWMGSPEEKEAIWKDFQKAKAWSEKHNRPIFLGEFGVYDVADIDSRVRYLSFVARLAEEMGWSWAYWQFDSDFILYDIPNNRWVEPVLKALIPSNEKSTESGPSCKKSA